MAPTARRPMSLTRRELLGTVGRWGVGVAGFSGGASPFARTGPAHAAPRTITLEARVMTWELSPGKKVMAMGYNGRVPGPEIRAREGERLRIAVQNLLPEPTSVHWHGLEVPHAMDGVGGLTQKPIASGESFVYEFDARPAGTRWYHTHVEEHRQMDMGLAGPFIIEPATAEPMAADREITLMLDDWRTGTGAPVPPTHDGIGAFRRRAPRAGGSGHAIEGDHAATYDTMTINGKAYPATEPLRLTRGERVRLRLVNASAEHTHVVRVAGHRLHVTHTDGNALEAPVEVDAVPIAPSERYDAVVVADRPGAWWLECLQPGHADAGERMLVVYAGHEQHAPGRDTEPPDNLRLWHYALGRGRPRVAPVTGTVREVEMALAGGLDGNNRWTINGRAFPDTERLALRRGDAARIQFVNVSHDAHPMHLHGQSFKVLGVGRGRLARPLVKDTVDVEPHMSSVTVEVTASNPGTWLLHCHKPTHMEGGMMALVDVT
ncbi:MAG: multicopper oxidase family protein [Candidatus Rokubacteria bacterium]|nr:multicopper oxidase family protein [Candidatus Rokubacteria bacterium]